MQLVHKVYYFQRNLYLIKGGAEPLPIIPYQIKSTTSALIMEEITAFLKKETESHFLHANEFEHWNICDKLLVLPTSVYDPQLKETYWNRMFGADPKECRLEEYASKSLKVQVIYEVPTWLNEFLKQQFNKTSSQSVVYDMLSDTKNGTLQMNLVISENSFIFSLRNDRELFYLDTQSYDSVEDILYCMLHVLIRQKLKVNNVCCNLYAFCASMTVQSLEQGMKKITELQSVAITEHVKPFI